MTAVGAAIGVRSVSDGVRAAVTETEKTQDSATEIENWYDLDEVRNDIDTDYVLVDNLGEMSDGYDEVVGDQTTDEFTESKSGAFEAGDEVTLTQTPLATVVATDQAGAKIDVGITDSDAGTVEFQETVGEDEVTVTFDYQTVTPLFVGFDPIGGARSRFSGTFDGQGNTIADLVINRPESDFVGLFGVVSSGQIEHVRMDNVDITGGDKYVGGVAGIASGTIIATQVCGSVTGGERVGGLIGNFSGGDVIESSASANVTGDDKVGGLVGQSFGDVTKSSASANVTGDDRVGGLVGQSFGDVTKSSASGDVIADAEFATAGGLVGLTAGGAEIRRSVASGDVAGNEGVGGLVGNIVAGRVVKSSASGDVTGTDEQNLDDTGALLGRMITGEVVESFASGEVTTDGNGAGILGTLGNFSIEPDEEAIVRDCYWDTQTTGQTDPVVEIDEGDGTAELRGDVSGFETDQLEGEAAKENMTALDFEETWLPDRTGPSYPVLQHRPMPAYANKSGVVETAGLRHAIGDWSEERLALEQLRQVIDAWGTGSPIEHL